MGNIFTANMDPRKYLKGTPLISSNEIKEEISTLAELLNTNENLDSTMNEYKFESMSKEDAFDYVNIFNEYVVFFDNSSYVSNIKLTDPQIVLFAYKPKSLSKFLYGNNDLYFIFFQFNNNLKHASDLSVDYLKNNHLRVLNNEGIKKLKELYNFMLRKQTSTIGLNTNETNNIFILKNRG
mgnify:FL=1